MRKAMTNRSSAALLAVAFLVSFFSVAPPSEGVGSLDRVGRKRALIDPSHGGSDRGIVHRSGYLEKDFALRLAKAIKRGLDRSGANIETLLTRDSDIDLEPDERARLANVEKVDLYISIHVGAALSVTAGSFNVCIDRRSSLSSGWSAAGIKHIQASRAFAKRLMRSARSEFPDYEINLIESSYLGLGAIDAPAVLVEAIDFSNPAIEVELADEGSIDRLTRAMIGPIVAYLGGSDR